MPAPDDTAAPLPPKHMLDKASAAMYPALAQLLHECVQAGFDTARDYNWPKSLADARAALALARGEDTNA